MSKRTQETLSKFQNYNFAGYQFSVHGSDYQMTTKSGTVTGSAFEYSCPL